MANLDDGSLRRHGSGDDGPSFSRSMPSAPLPIWRLKSLTIPSVRRLKAQIIPRIFLALRPGLAPSQRAEPVGETNDRIASFAALSIGADDEACGAFVAQLIADGTTIDQVLLAWLAPAARFLGEQWENDAADFVSVTIGISRLQRVLHTLGEKFAEEIVACGKEAILLTALPGEQHSFGLSMVAEFFRRAGWSLCTGPFAAREELIMTVQERWFDVVGFSVSSDRNLGKLKQDIAAVRSGSRNPQVGIMLGGPMLATHPELVTTLGADMMSVNAVSAPDEASALVIRMTARA